MDENFKLLFRPLERIARATLRNGELLPLFNEAIALVERKSIMLFHPDFNETSTIAFLSEISYAVAFYLIRKVPLLLALKADQLDLYLSNELTEVFDEIPVRSDIFLSASYGIIREKYKLVNLAGIDYLASIVEAVKSTIYNSARSDYFRLVLYATVPNNDIYRLFGIIYREIIILKEITIFLGKDLASIVDEYVI